MNWSLGARDESCYGALLSWTGLVSRRSRPREQWSTHNSLCSTPYEAAVAAAAGFAGALGVVVAAGAG
ncbi:MAG: hypothetical protein WBD25_15440, partial [Terriglobales bacterium]